MTVLNDGVDVIVRMARQDAERIAAAPNSFHELQGRAAAGHIDRVLKVTFRGLHGSEGADGDGLVAVRVGMAAEQASELIAAISSFIVGARFQKVSKDVSAMANNPDMFVAGISELNRNVREILAAQTHSSIASLQAAYVSAKLALRRNDIATLAGAARDAHGAALQLKNLAASFATVTAGLPKALQFPLDFVGMAGQAHQALMATATIYLLLGEKQEAVNLLLDHVETLKAWRGEIREALLSESTQEARLSEAIGDDSLIINAGIQTAAMIKEANDTAEMVNIGIRADNTGLFTLDGLTKMSISFDILTDAGSLVSTADLAAKR